MIDFDIHTALSKCAIKDRFRLSKQFTQMKAKPTDAISQAQWEAFLNRVSASQQIVTYRQSILPAIEYPSLPVSDKKEEIKQLITDNQVVIIAGETGSGKTTQIPKMCLELGRGVHGYIGHTQPRRLAARSVANRIADEINSELGDKVGFKVRFNDKVSGNSLVKLMTDGILLAEIQNDRFLNDYDTIIIDEAHERSLNIDFILGYLKRLLPKRPDLKVIITSATIDPQRFSKHFNDAPIIEVSGRTYPVEIRYKDPVDHDDLDQLGLITLAVDELMREAPGDILIFLSGERDIRDAEDVLRKRAYRNTEVLPLYARLSAGEQQRIFAPHSGRRIILSTNVAETSLTVPGIKYVVDTGFARISRYSARSKVQRLPIEPISQASANQRSGRCGRLSDGIAIRLYAESDYDGRDGFTDPEILRTHLSSVILQMLSLGLGDVSQFPFVQPPDERQINDGIKLLEELDAIIRRKQQWALTDIGQRMSKLPLDPRYARMLIESSKHDAVYEVAVITSGLSVQDPRERPQERQQQADTAHAEFADKSSDLISLLNLYECFKQQQKALTNNQLRKWCKNHFIHFQRMREWQDIVSQIKQTLVAVNLRLNSSSADYEAVHRSIAVGLLSQIGMKDKNKIYLGCRNSQFMIFPGSNVVKSQPKWVMAAELVETSKLFARQAAKIEPEWLEQISEHIAKKHYAEPYWSKERGCAQAFLTITLFGLPIVNRRRTDYSKVDPVVSRELFIREALVFGHTRLKYAFLRHNQSQIDAVELLEKKARRRDILVDEEVLSDFYQEKIPPSINTEADFKKWWQKASQKSPNLLNFDYNDLLKKTPDGISKSDFPDEWKQGNLTLKLSYHFEPNQDIDGVCLHIPLSVLNQVHNIGFDWLVPGMRHELVVNMIKALPKRLRRNFVPAPDYAHACLSEIQWQDKNGAAVALLDALAQKLFRMSGVRVNAEDFELTNLPAHLQFNFAVVNEKGKIISHSKSLNALKKKLQSEVKQTIEEVASVEIEDKDLQRWTIGSLPTVYKRKQAGFEINGFPALQVNNNKVDVVVLSDKSLAKKSHAHGVLTLIKRNIPSPVKYLQQKLPNKAKLSLYFNPFGQISILIDDIIYASLNSLCNDLMPIQAVRETIDFNRLLEHGRMNLNDKALEIAKDVELGLATANSIQKLIKGNVPLNMITSVGHVKKQLDLLVFKGFVEHFGEGKLNDWNRYLLALLQRAEKLKIDPNRDRLNQIELDKAEGLYQSALNKRKQQMLSTDDLDEVKWMLEEFKVSLFAQQLGTNYPISLKRIKNKLDEL
ncbi:ATP-dependent RNA helicase HrpA [Agaribacter marinus]|uniref:ATP-dependent RNA helicase HrpA n=1 Tax=Agaribacter marinus TaxID=1431249 RepID=A0AA37SW46_9ALTE|nr:ATP-dependent RNA helicase HrpA [Agaribacter marinus]GLR70162.1 ATP-dependent RNA helicase HrpA [Agaribacter marinus]